MGSGASGPSGSRAEPWPYLPKQFEPTAGEVQTIACARRFSGAAMQAGGETRDPGGGEGV